MDSDRCNVLRIGGTQGQQSVRLSTIDLTALMAICPSPPPLRTLPSSPPLSKLDVREPGNLPVAYLVTQDGIWGSGSDDVGLIQSTKAPKCFGP